MAHKDNKSVPEPSIPVSEMLKSIPEFFGVRVNEEPTYDLVEQMHNFEIRRYAPRWIAEVTGEEKDFDSFRENAFKRLANYIFGDNHQDKQLAMTAPVVMQLTPGTNELEERSLMPALGSRSWTMAFVLPASLKQKEIPKPADAGIQVRRAPAQDFAVYSYSGNNTPEKILEGEERLGTWLKERKDLRGTGSFLVAQYDAPFVIPFLKKNEVMIAVEKLQ